MGLKVWNQSNQSNLNHQNKSIKFKSSKLIIKINITNETSLKAQSEEQTNMHELKTQKLRNQDRLSQRIMHRMPILMLSLPHLIQPRKMQIQTHHNQGTRKKITLENGQLAHPSRSLLSQVKTPQVWWPCWTRLTYWAHQPSIKTQNHQSYRRA